MLRILKDRRDTAHRLLSSIEGVRCYRPNVTFYLFPNVTELMKRLGIPDQESLRVTVLRETGVSFCTRMHFGRPLPGETDYYIRLAYSGINADQIEEGLGKLKAFTER